MLERHQKIIDLVNSQEKVEVKELAKILGVSAVTIRKDLDYLAGKSLLVKEHGYAERYREEDQTNRFFAASLLNLWLNGEHLFVMVMSVMFALTEGIGDTILKHLCLKKRFMLLETVRQGMQWISVLLRTDRRCLWRSMTDLRLDVMGQIRSNTQNFFQPAGVNL